MPPRGKELSKDLKDAIIKLYKESKSQRQIAKIIGKSPATLQKIIEKFQAEGNTLNKPRTGRPPIFTDQERQEGFLPSFGLALCLCCSVSPSTFQSINQPNCACDSISIIEEINQPQYFCRSQ
ncbi:hypothetical protein TNCT_109141 [Trichonephila clavata]|uniref:Uncharacterized protein n=1 Tax=Trichonephila clavata TaxID=2740835 RepID=A0A8X6EZ08_TRICU|nr:hypothetical protein TNCT_109141 [Trichonephila clavata]